MIQKDVIPTTPDHLDNRGTRLMTREVAVATILLLELSKFAVDARGLRAVSKGLLDTEKYPEGRLARIVQEMLRGMNYALLVYREEGEIRVGFGGPNGGMREAHFRVTLKPVLLEASRKIYLES